MIFLMELKILAIEGRDEEAWSPVREYFTKRKDTLFRSARSAGDAIKALKSGDFGFVLLDYNIPRVNTTNFLERIKSLKPHVEVIVLSGPTPLGKAIELMKAGAYDFYEFPVNTKLLMAVIGKAKEKQSLYLEKEELERQVREKFDLGNIVGHSPALQKVGSLIRSIAPRNVSVLITGETGTGKELVASAIHYNSPRSARPLIKVNCSAFNEGVLESELFGHERGAFTGAIAQRIGRFELANGGTLFLDEVGDLSPSTQIKLLRVLQEKAFERVGGNETIHVDVRVIAATNRELKSLIREGRFREDLYYRLNVVHIDLPPLREREEDVPILTNYFVNLINEENGYSIRGVTREAMKILVEYPWPGNVRELRHAIESAMTLTEGNMVEAKFLPAFLTMHPHAETDHYQMPKSMTLPEIEQEIIEQALQHCGGNRTRASRMLGIGLRTLQRKIKPANS